MNSALSFRLGYLVMPLVFVYMIRAHYPCLQEAGTSKNRRFPPPCKSDSRFSCSERGRLAWDSVASSI